MSINNEELMNLKKLANLSYVGDILIVLDPEKNDEETEVLKNNILFDTADWKIPVELQQFFLELKNDNIMSDEDKILAIYEKICETYVYDDNLISYIQKIDDSVFYIPDWYGRDVDEEWERNRQQHNRRVCFELSRYLAKAISELFKEREDFNICIFWDQDKTHYFVGLTSDEFSLTLDLDDFNNIKDLTRIKTGLTAEGIKVLKDKDGRFGRALDIFNSHREQDAKNNVESQIDSNQEMESDDYFYFKAIIEVLKENYNLDSQGTFEYLKEIIDDYLGSENRDKVWKMIPGNNDVETRHIRCLLINIQNNIYLIDVDQMNLRKFHEDELKGEERIFIPYNELEREDEEIYNGI